MRPVAVMRHHPCPVQPWMCNPVLPRLCASCGESELHRKLMKCASCQMKWYCSKACQVAHWKQGAQPQISAPASWSADPLVCFHACLYTGT